MTIGDEPNFALWCDGDLVAVGDSFVDVVMSGRVVKGVLPDGILVVRRGQRERIMSVPDYLKESYMTKPARQDLVSSVGSRARVLSDCANDLKRILGVYLDTIPEDER